MEPYIKPARPYSWTKDTKMKPEFQQDVDARFTTPICYMGSFLGLLPLNRFQINCKNEKKLHVCYQLYAILILIIMIIGSTLAVKGRIDDVYPVLPSATIMITDIAVQLSTLLTNITSILAPSFWYLQNYNEFTEHFLSYTNCLHQDEIIKKERCWKFTKKLIIAHLTLFTIFLFDAYVWINLMGIKVFKHYIFRNLQIYHLFSMATVMYNFALTIQHRFEALNNSLRNTSSLSQIKWTAVVGNRVISEKIERAQEIRRTTNVYQILIEQVNLFNQVFGWQILFITFSIMTNLLNCLDVLTVFSVLEKNVEEYSTSLIYQLIALTTIWSLWMFALGAGITASCNEVTKEAQNTANICYNHILKLPVVHENAEEKLFKQELNLLKQLVVHRSPAFSAAGFFNVDYSLLLALFGSVTSYIIVLIQFNK